MSIKRIGDKIVLLISLVKSYYFKYDCNAYKSSRNTKLAIEIRNTLLLLFFLNWHIIMYCFNFHYISENYLLARHNCHIAVKNCILYNFLIDLDRTMKEYKLLIYSIKLRLLVNRKFQNLIELKLLCLSVLIAMYF